MKLFSIHKIALALMLITLIGCDAQHTKIDNGRPQFYVVLPAHHPWYHIGFYNDTGAKLDNVRFEWPIKGQLYYCAAGFLNIGSAGSFSQAPDPIPAEGTVYWQTPDGAKHEQHVSPAGAVKNQRTFDGTIWFKIGKDGAIVEAVTDAESWDRAERHLPEVP